VPYEPDQLSWNAQVRHNLSGNVMRQSADNTIRADEKWRSEMNVSQKTLVRTLTAPAMALAMAEGTVRPGVDLHPRNPVPSPPTP
ncbi:MAG TPA: hypothetical protein VK943_12935, partial [Arenibaculum sp.]|nr:hypothetical protein [Arenibaculum sp.]